jgi:hypothetical protein
VVLNSKNRSIIYFESDICYRKRGNLQSRARTHAIWVIGLYELLGNSTT